MSKKQRIHTIDSAVNLIAAADPGIKSAKVFTTVDQLSRKAPFRLTLDCDAFTAIVSCLLYQRYYLNFHPQLSVAPILLVDGATEPNMEMLQRLERFAYTFSKAGIFSYSLDPVIWENRGFYYCPKRAHDLVAQRPTAKLAVRKQIENVEGMNNPLLIKNCTPKLRWKINVRRCRFDCGQRNGCRYRQFTENIRRGRHKVIICSRLRLSRELQFSSITNRIGLPGLGYIVFPSQEDYNKFPESGNHRTSLREREVHSLLNRCEMGLHQYQDTKDKELLCSIRDIAEQLFAYIRSEGRGPLQHPERVQAYLKGLDKAFDCFMLSRTYPLRDQYQVHSALLRTRSQVAALLDTGTILAEDSGSGAVALTGRKSVDMLLPEDARVIISTAGSV